MNYWPIFCQVNECQCCINALETHTADIPLSGYTGQLSTCHKRHGLQETLNRPAAFWSVAGPPTKPEIWPERQRNLSAKHIAPWFQQYSVQPRRCHHLKKCCVSEKNSLKYKKNELISCRNCWWCVVFLLNEETYPFKESSSKAASTISWGCGLLSALALWAR